MFPGLPGATAVDKVCSNVKGCAHCCPGALLFRLQRRDYAGEVKQTGQQNTENLTTICRIFNPNVTTYIRVFAIANLSVCRL